MLNNSQDDSILPLIVFDEIGLADLQNNPLKILHSLSGEKAELAFVGISTGASSLEDEPRRLPRAPDPDLEDLEHRALDLRVLHQSRASTSARSEGLAKTCFEFKKAQKELGFSDLPRHARLPRAAQAGHARVHQVRQLLGDEATDPPRRSPPTSVG